MVGMDQADMESIPVMGCGVAEGAVDRGYGERDQRGGC